MNQVCEKSILPDVARPTKSALLNRGLASQIKDHWKRGNRADARAALSEHPELAADKSIILDLAYEEYCLHREAGELPDPDAFCERFPDYKASLRRLIEAHRFLEEEAHLLAPVEPQPFPSSGESFLGFSLIHELGRGAFARVFLAAEPALGNRLVAVKVSHSGSAEAETLGRINHTNIVPVHSVRQDKLSGFTVVCMPYLGNSTLCDVLDRVFADKSLPRRAHVILDAIQIGTRPDLTPVETRPPAAVFTGATYIDGVIHIGAALADALACIHALGICHRDLKPSNVLMSTDGRPMLLDFNLSFDQKIADNRLGGTLPYMSPEQLLATDGERRADPSLVDARSELFSLGIMLYELLTGVHPYGPIPLKLSSKELRQKLLERQRADLGPIQKLNSMVDRRLARIVERCLAYNPNDRPQTASELAAALRSCLAPLPRLRRWTRAHSRQVFAATVVASTTLAGGLYLLAVQDSYPVREYKKGLAAYSESHYDEALEHFDGALRADAQNRDALIARARAYQHSGGLDRALIDYRQAERIAPDAKLNASIAYCLTLLKQHPEAVLEYRRALNGGFTSAATLNNLGYCLVQLGDLERAKQVLDQAIKLDPNLQPAFYNRAWLHLRLAARSRDVPLSGIKDIARASGTGPITADLRSLAARLCIMEALRDRLVLQNHGTGSGLYHYWIDKVYYVKQAFLYRYWIDMAICYVKQAVKFGQDPQQFNLPDDVNFKFLVGEPEFKALLKQPGPKCLPAKAMVVLDPLQ